MLVMFLCIAIGFLLRKFRLAPENTASVLSKLELNALLPILCILVLGIFAMRSSAVGRSSFYTIGACTAASILLAQTILNVMGTIDLLPFTGVTFPFVSNGGSAMISAWGLMAFVKAADVRQNASFAIRIPNQRRNGEFR